MAKAQVPLRPGRMPDPRTSRPERRLRLSLLLLPRWPGPMLRLPERLDLSLPLPATLPDRMQPPVTCCVPIRLHPARQLHRMPQPAGPCVPVLSMEYQICLELYLPGACQVPPGHLLAVPGSHLPWHRAMARPVRQGLLVRLLRLPVVQFAT